MTMLGGFCECVWIALAIRARALTVRSHKDHGRHANIVVVDIIVVVLV